MRPQYPNASRRRSTRWWTKSQRGPASRTRFLFIAGVYLALSLAVATAGVAAIHRHSEDAALAQNMAAPKPKYLVMFVLDGARPDYFGLTPLRHVDDLIKHGATFTNTIAGILESETPSGHATISTGSTPARNGILGFNWAMNDKDYSLFSPDVVRSGAMEHIMQSMNVPTIGGLYKAKFPGAKVVALSGHKYYAADPLGGPSADAIMYFQGDPQGKYIPVAIPGHVPPIAVLDAKTLTFNTTQLPIGVEDTLATKLALNAFKYMHQRLTLINEPEFDWPLGHVDGGSTDRANVIKAMKAFDSDLGRVESAFRKAGILNQTLFVITADHGMSPLTRFIPVSVLQNAVAAAGTKAPEVSQSTGGYIWLSDPGKAATVAANIIKTNDPGIQSVYYLDGQGTGQHYVQASGLTLSPAADAANLYLLHSFMNGHQPTVVAFCRAGATFSNSSTHWKADHGGSEWQSQHMPLIISGPGIRSGTYSSPAQMEDIAPTILRVMGVNPTGMEGKVLTEAIYVPADTDGAGRDKEIKTLNPVIDALVAEDRYETSAF